MVQEFYVIRCSTCKSCQVQIVRKDGKFICKMCGLKQSVVKVYGRGSAKDCRVHAQKLNTFIAQQSLGKDMALENIIFGSSTNTAAFHTASELENGGNLQGPCYMRDNSSETRQMDHNQTEWMRGGPANQQTNDPVDQLTPATGNRSPYWYGHAGGSNDQQAGYWDDWESVGAVGNRFPIPGLNPDSCARRSVGVTACDELFGDVSSCKNQVSRKIFGNGKPPNSDWNNISRSLVDGFRSSVGESSSVGQGQVSPAFITNTQEPPSTKQRAISLQEQAPRDLQPVLKRSRYLSPNKSSYQHRSQNKVADEKSSNIEVATLLSFKSSVNLLDEGTSSGNVWSGKENPAKIKVFEQISKTSSSIIPQLEVSRATINSRVGAVKKKVALPKVKDLLKKYSESDEIDDICF